MFILSWRQWASYKVTQHLGQGTVQSHHCFVLFVFVGMGICNAEINMTIKNAILTY